MVNGHLTVPGQPDEESRAQTPVDVMAEEDDMETLLGRRSAAADGARPSPFAHAPHITNERKPTYAMFVGDQKLDRVFMQPKYFTEFDQSGEQVRTLRMTQQAPGKPGLYTFQMFVKSDCFIDTDIRKDMKVGISHGWGHLRKNLTCREQMRVEEATAAEQAEDDDVCDFFRSN